MMAAPMTFDPEFASPAEWARMYRAQGLQVVPAPFPMRSKNDKRPDLPGWTEFQGELVSDAVFERWFPLTPTKRTNFGVIAGAASGRLLVIDIDDYAGGQGAEWWRSVTGDIEPETWVQTTGGGGRQYFFTIPAGVDHLDAPDADRGHPVPRRVRHGAAVAAHERQGIRVE
jgi:hypothetical protein